MSKLPNGFLDHDTYMSSLPRKRISAGIVILNNQDEILLVKPSYRDYWTIPGGVVEKDESPLAGCIRETNEEVGLKLTPSNLLATIYEKNKNGSDESIHMFFYYGRITQSQIESIKIDGDEIEKYEFVSLDKINNYNERISGYVDRFRNEILTGSNIGYVEFEYD